jgi:hypothetical protein
MSSRQFVVEAGFSARDKTKKEIQHYLCHRHIPYAVTEHRAVTKTIFVVSLDCSDGQWIELKSHFRRFQEEFQKKT